jgi:hypothetical protein
MRHKNHVPFLVVGRDQQAIRFGAIPTTKQQKIQASETIAAQTNRFLAHGGKIAREDESDPDVKRRYVASFDASAEV